MATPVYVLTINGVTVRPLRLGFEIREVANGRNRMTLSLYSATGAPPIALFDTVQLTEDGVVIFGGHVDAPTEAGAVQPRTAAGLLHAASPQAVINATVKSGKRLN